MRCLPPSAPRAVRGAVSDLLGADAWDAPRDWGTILVTFPRRDRPWAVPARGWHPDYGLWHDPQPLLGVKVFFAGVRSRGGGTLVIPGSHRVGARFAASLTPQQRRDRHRMARLLRHRPVDLDHHHRPCPVPARPPAGR